MSFIFFVKQDSKMTSASQQTTNYLETSFFLFFFPPKIELISEFCLIKKLYILALILL